MTDYSKGGFIRSGESVSNETFHDELVLSPYHYHALRNYPTMKEILEEGDRMSDLNPLPNNSLTPQPKVAASMVAGAVTILAVFVASLFGLNLPEAVTAAVTALVTAGVAYLKSN